MLGEPFTDWRRYGKYGTNFEPNCLVGFFATIPAISLYFFLQVLYVVKQNQFRITFDTQLKIALLFFVLLFCCSYVNVFT